MRYILFFVAFNLAANHFSQQALEYRAEGEGYGYKTANLMEIQPVFQNESQIKIPEFLGIPSSTIQNLLSQSGLNLQNAWNRIIQKQNIVSETLGQALANKILPQGFLDPNLELAEQIKAHFSNINNPKLPELIAFLSKAKQNHWRLMVRSTGKEDTDKLANAGGNLSKSNIPAEMPAVLKAIGQVIASYFEERSFSQRLSAGDKTLFDLPLTPVLIQRMVGEELNGASDPLKIPIGCVLYTEETASRSPHIYTFQCAYGHNEGVVESLVPLDTYYVEQSGQIQSVVKVKTKRMVPVLEKGIFGLEEQNNPISLQSKPALDQAAIQLISRAGRIIDSFYQKRMDIELVYEPWTQTIYIVQARPLVIPHSKEQPSYLTAVASFSDQEVIRLISINPGNSAATRIQASNQIITAQSLGAALQIYAAPSFDRLSVKAIIVAEQADPTSHAAAVLRGDSKLIFETEHLETLKTWLLENPLNLMIDIQRGLILNLKSQTWVKQDLRDLFEQRILKFGWLSYPLPLRISVGIHQPQYCLAPQMKPDNFYGEVTCLVDRLENQVQELHQFTQRTRAQADCDLNQPDCLEQKALATQLLPKLEDLNTHADELMEQIKTNANQDLPELLTLFPKRFLESLMNQPAKSHLADAYSVESIRQEFADGQRLIENTLTPLIKTEILSENILRDTDLFRIAQIGEKASLTEKTTQRFLRFVDQTPDKAKLISLIDNLNTLNSLPMWLNGLFMEAAEQTDQDELKRPYEWPLLEPGYGFSTPTSGKLLNQLDVEYQASKTYLEALQNKKSQMTSYDMSKWSNAKAFEKTRADFQKKFESYFNSESFLGFNTPLQTIAAVSTMEQYVELFDQSIKTLKSRTDTARVGQFKIRIQDYLDLLKAWAAKAPTQLIKFHSGWPLQQYLSTVQELLSAKTELRDEELMPSAEFSVDAAALGAATEFVRHFPERLEDFFTLIHQSLNTCMGVWNTQILAGLLVPLSFEGIWKNLNESDKYPLYLTGIRVDRDSLKYSINMPLANHSGKLTLVYEKATRNIDLTFYFMSEARERWSFMNDYVRFLAEHEHILVSDRVQDASSIRFRIDSINNLTNFNIAEFKNDLAELSMQRGFVDKLIQKYTLPYLESWALKNNALGLGATLMRSRVVEDKFLVEIAKKGSASLDPASQAISLMIFFELIRRPAVLTDAIETLERLSPHLNLESLQQAVLLIGSIPNSQELLSRIAKQNAYSTNSYSKAFALFCYNELLKQGSSPLSDAQAALSAVEQVKSDDSKIR